MVRMQDPLVTQRAFYKRLLERRNEDFLEGLDSSTHRDARVLVGVRGDAREKGDEAMTVQELTLNEMLCKVREWRSSTIMAWLALEYVARMVGEPPPELLEEQQSFAKVEERYVRFVEWTLRAVDARIEEQQSFAKVEERYVRFVEWTLRAVDARITELLAHNTRLVMENRVLKKGNAVLLEKEQRMRALLDGAFL